MSETISIHAALLRARCAMEAPQKNAVNPHFKSKYAPLDELVRVSLKPLADNGLMVTQNTRVKDGRMVLETRIVSATDILECGDYDLGQMATPQAMGSAITYGRRYTLAAVLGLAAEDDDDGNAGTESSKAPAQQQQKGTSPSAPRRELTLDRASLEADYVEAWRATRTKDQLADKEDWRHRGDAVKSILGMSRFIRLSEMTDDQIRRCIMEWRGGEVPPPTDDDIRF